MRLFALHGHLSQPLLPHAWSAAACPGGLRLQPCPLYPPFLKYELGNMQIRFYHLPPGLGQSPGSERLPMGWPPLEYSRKLSPVSGPSLWLCLCLATCHHHPSPASSFPLLRCWPPEAFRERKVCPSGALPPSSLKHQLCSLSLSWQLLFM